MVTGGSPRSLPLGRRVRHPAMPLRPRHGYAVDNSPWPPNPGTGNPIRSSPPVMKGRVRAAVQPTSTGLELVKGQEA